jgi:hypothetical protein
MNTDVTELFQIYRECVRHLWNSHFVRTCKTNNTNDGSQDRFDIRDRFAALSSTLFDEVVLRPTRLLRYSRYSEYSMPYPFKEALRPFQIQADGGECTLLIENKRPDDGNTYWDHPLRKIDPRLIDLRFIDYFDWDSTGWRDYEYFRVNIASCAKDKLVEGRQALVKVNKMRVLVVSD